MMILSLVRNYIPSHDIVRGDGGGWNVADCVQRAYDVEGMSVGTVAAVRIGLAVLRRMYPFGCDLRRSQRSRLPRPRPRLLRFPFAISKTLKHTNTQTDRRPRCCTARTTQTTRIGIASPRTSKRSWGSLFTRRPRPCSLTLTSSP